MSGGGESDCGDGSVAHGSDESHGVVEIVEGLLQPKLRQQSVAQHHRCDAVSTEPLDHRVSFER